jgi:hypothetical protein
MTNGGVFRHRKERYRLVDLYRILAQGLKVCQICLELWMQISEDIWYISKPRDSMQFFLKLQTIKKY